MAKQPRTLRRREKGVATFNVGRGWFAHRGLGGAQRGQVLRE